MEQDNFDNMFRESLRGREIAPSPEAWERLEERLSADPSERKHLLKWIAVAAALSGLILGTDWFVDRAQTRSEEIEVTSEEPASPAIIQTGSHQIPAQKDAIVSEPGEPPRTELLTVLEFTDFGLLQSAEGLTSGEAGPLVTIPDPIPQKVTDQEIEALLSSAMVEIRKDTNPREQISGAQLLEVVEFELEESFREKVFEVMREGLSKARTAIANRNIQ